MILPSEVLLIIYEFADTRTRGKMRQINKEWRNTPTGFIGYQLEIYDEYGRVALHRHKNLLKLMKYFKFQTPIDRAMIWEKVSIFGKPYQRRIFNLISSMDVQFSVDEK